MICPKCKNEMTQVMRHALPIDTCGMCGGVWLEKGVLGELLPRMRQAESSLDQELSRAQPQRPPQYDRTYYREEDHRYRDHDEHHSDHDHQKYGHKKRSIWDIFD